MLPSLARPWYTSLSSMARRELSIDSMFTHTRRHSLLAGILEGSNEVGHIIVISLSGGFTVEVSELALQELVLLRSNLLEDIGHHILEVLCLGGSSNDEEVLSDGELGYRELECLIHLLCGLLR